MPPSPPDSSSNKTDSETVEKLRGELKTLKKVTRKQEDKLREAEAEKANLNTYISSLEEFKEEQFSELEKLRVKYEEKEAEYEDMKESMKEVIKNKNK